MIFGIELFVEQARRLHTAGIQLLSHPATQLSTFGTRHMSEPHDTSGLGASRGQPQKPAPASPGSGANESRSRGPLATPPAGLAELDARQLRGELAARLFGKPREHIQIGRFQIVRRLGAGGMGVVYEARDEQLDRSVAIKLLHRACNDGDERRRMLREAQALARLSHPNVLQIHEVGEFEGQVFIAMELVRGTGLRELQTRKSAGLAERIDPWLQAARGLAAAHDAGLVHRDFKPDNALVGEDRRVRVADFGLAAALPPAGAAARGRLKHDNASPWSEDWDSVDLGLNRAPDSGRSELESSLTVSGTLLGTPAYMSPEQFRCVVADARSDQFSFCVALYEALVGHRPFAGSSLSDLSEAVCSGRRRESVVFARLPKRLRAAIDRGLASDPVQRFADMPALIAALEAAVHRRPRLTMVSFATVGILIGALVVPSKGQDHAQVCRQRASAELERVWSPQVAQDLARVHSEIGGGFDSKMGRQIRAALDDYGDTWKGRRVEACQQSSDSQSIRDPLTHSRRQLCLSQAHAAFGAIVELLGQPDARDAKRALLAVDQLPTLDSCAKITPDSMNHGRGHDDKNPTAALDLQMTAEQREATTKIESELTKAQVQLIFRRVEAGQSAGREALRLADQFGLAHERARAYRVLGELAIVGQDYERGLARLADAQRIAAHEGSHATQIRALTARVRGLTAQARYLEARAAADDAWALLERHGPNARLEAELSSRQGILETYAAQPCRARAHYARTLELRRTTHGPGHVMVARDHINLGLAEIASGQDELAIKTLNSALRIFADGVGLDHPDVAHAYTNLAHSSARAAEAKSEPAARRKLQLHALDLLQKGQKLRDTPSSHTNLGWIELQLGQLDAAQKSYTRAREIVAEKHGRQHPLMFHALAGLGNTLITRARSEAEAEPERSASETWREGVAQLRAASELARKLGDKLTAAQRGQVAFDLAQALAHTGGTALGPDAELEGEITELLQTAHSELRAVRDGAIAASEEQGCASPSEVQRHQRKLEDLADFAQLRGIDLG